MDFQQLALTYNPFFAEAVAHSTSAPSAKPLIVEPAASKPKLKVTLHSRREFAREDEDDDEDDEPASATSIPASATSIPASATSIDKKPAAKEEDDELVDYEEPRYDDDDATDTPMAGDASSSSSSSHTNGAQSHDIEEGERTDEPSAAAPSPHKTDKRTSSPEFAVNLNIDAVPTTEDERSKRTRPLVVTTKADKEGILRRKITLAVPHAHACVERSIEPRKRRRSPAHSRTRHVDPVNAGQPTLPLSNARPSSAPKPDTPRSRSTDSSVKERETDPSAKDPTLDEEEDGLFLTQVDKVRDSSDARPPSQRVVVEHAKSPELPLEYEAGRVRNGKRLEKEFHDQKRPSSRRRRRERVEKRDASREKKKTKRSRSPRKDRSRSRTREKDASPRGRSGAEEEGERSPSPPRLMRADKPRRTDRDTDHGDHSSTDHDARRRNEVRRGGHHRGGGGGRGFRNEWTQGRRGYGGFPPPPPPPPGFFHHPAETGIIQQLQMAVSQQQQQMQQQTQQQQQMQQQIQEVLRVLTAAATGNSGGNQ